MFVTEVWISNQHWFRNKLAPNRRQALHEPQSFWVHVKAGRMFIFIISRSQLISVCHKTVSNQHTNEIQDNRLLN